jgi:hypothetical protein
MRWLWLSEKVRRQMTYQPIQVIARHCSVCGEPIARGQATECVWLKEKGYTWEFGEWVGPMFIVHKHHVGFSEPSTFENFWSVRYVVDARPLSTVTP